MTQGYGQGFTPPPENPFEQQQYYQQYGQKGLYRSSGRAYEWQDVWQMAVTSPDVETYEELLGDPNASVNRGATWIFVVALIGGFIGLIGQLLFGVSVFSMAGDSSGQAGFMGASLICGIIFIPIGAALGVFFLGLWVGIVHIIASFFGGQGRFDALFYSFSTFTAPMSVVTSVIGIIPLIGGIINFFLGLYTLFLQVIAVQAVHKLGFFPSCASVLIFPILLLGMALCCIFALLGSLGGSTTEVLENIINTLEATP